MFDKPKRPAGKTSCGAGWRRKGLEVKADAEAPENGAVVEVVGDAVAVVERPGVVHEREDEGLGLHVQLETGFDAGGPSVAGVFTVETAEVDADERTEVVHAEVV